MALTDEEEAALRDQLAGAQQRGEEAAAAARKANLTVLLKDIGAPAAFADVVPGTIELTPEALKDWTAQFLPAPSTVTDRPDLSGWERYERTAEAGSPPGPGKSEIDLLLEEGLKGIQKLRGTGLDWDHRQPPEEMQQENAEFAAKANKLNRQATTMVRRGEMEPGGYYRAMGFGGRHDPPSWAYVAEDGRVE
jgi:hypothetical protein